MNLDADEGTLGEEDPAPEVSDDKDVS